jgi:hypothetical protein
MRRHYRSLSLSSLALAGALFCFTAAPSAFRAASELPQSKTRDVYVSITDKSGAPAKDVGITDLTIREDGQSREVLAVAPARTPMRIALLIDNSQATQSSVNEIRSSMSGFINTIFKASPDSTMSISTFGDRPTLVQDFTNAAPVLVKAAQKTFPMTGAGAYLVDAVFDATKALRKNPAPRQLIVAFVEESGEEFSNSGRQQVLDALRYSNASLWIVTMQSGATNMSTSEARDRSALIDEGTTQSGGTTLSLLNRLALPAKMTELAGILTNQLQITYGRSEQTVPPKKLEIQLARKDLRILAPRWAGQ